MKNIVASEPDALQEYICSIVNSEYLYLFPRYDILIKGEKYFQNTLPERM